MKKITFGVDIGGINTAIGIVDSQGELYAQSSFKTCSFPNFDNYGDYFETLCTEMRGLLSTLDFEWELVGIGLGAPNASFHSGCIEQPANLWKFTPQQSERQDSERIFNITKQLQERFPEASYVAITNDANAATIGEMLFGNGRGMKDFIMVTLGTGLGSGFISGGKMIYGHDGFAGELGHVIVERDGRECGCGRKGCLETYVSATGIGRTAFELMASSRTPSPLRDVPFSQFDSLLLSKAAEAGDPLAIEAFRFTGEILGRALADICTITSPEAIILFGGLAKSGDLILEPTRRYMEQNMLYTYKGKVKLLPSGLQDKNIAVIGASALVWQLSGESN